MDGRFHTNCQQKNASPTTPGPAWSFPTRHFTVYEQNSQLHETIYLRVQGQNSLIQPHERTLTPPELLLSFDPGLAAKILDKATRTRFAIQATLLADGPNTCIDRMQDLSPEEEEHLGSIQESKEAFCVGLSIVREDGYIKTQQRVEHEFRCLYERSGH